MLRPLLVLGEDGKVRVAYRDQRTGMLMYMNDTDAQTVYDRHIRIAESLRRIKEASDKLRNNVVDFPDRKK
jgi:hypothetical protein